MNKVVAFGEIMLRLSTERFLRFSQSRSFGASYGGCEFNVAVALANYGLNTQFVTNLPNNELGSCVLQEMRKLGVGAKHVKLVADRLGIYFLETGASMRSSNVVYDRANSGMAALKNGDIDWDEVLEDATWFHWSGITAALSLSAAKECLAAVKVAKKKGLTISTDLNYRSKLWKYGMEPKEVMPELLAYSNIILGDLDTAFFMLGVPQENPDYRDTKALPELYDTLFSHAPDLKIAATTLRYSLSASHQRIGGILYDGSLIYEADIKNVTPVIDRVGSGDAFMAGLIYGLLIKPENKQYSLDFAVASCCLKHTISGDYNLVTLDEIDKIMHGDSFGKVSR